MSEMPDAAVKDAGMEWARCASCGYLVAVFSSLMICVACVNAEIVPAALARENHEWTA